MKTLLILSFTIGCATNTVHKPVAQPPVAAAAAPVPAMAVASARPERCSLRVTEQRVMVDGDLMSLDDAIAVCSNRAAVLVELADDADQAVWSQLDAAFVGAKVPVLHRGVRGHETPAKPVLIF